MLHRIVGLTVFVSFILLKLGYLGSLTTLQEVETVLAGGSGLSRAERGVTYITLIVLVTSYLLVFPRHAVDKFSPRSGPMSTYIIPPPIWVIFGYIGLLATVILYAVFR